MARRLRVLRVLNLCEYASLNGGEYSLLTALDQMPSITPMIASPPGPLADECIGRGWHHHELQIHDDDGQRYSAARITDVLCRLAEDSRADLIHANSLATSRWSGRAANHLSIPCLGHLRDIIKLSKAAIADLNANERLLAVSETTRQFHCRQGLSQEKTFVCYNGVDVTEFAPANPNLAGFRANWMIPEDSPLLLTIGQIGLRKGWDVIIESARRVLARRPECHWVLVGERHSQKQESIEFHNRLLEAVNSAGLHNHVHFVGRREDVATLLREADLLVHAARQEPLGRVLLEAAASQCPVVCTDVGGTREIFSPQQAILVPVDDTTAMTQAILELLADEPRRCQMAQAARNRILTQFTASQAAQQLEQHYRDLVRGP